MLTRRIPGWLRLLFLGALMATLLPAHALLYQSNGQRIKEPFDTFSGYAPYRGVLVIDYALSAEVANALTQKGATFHWRLVDTQGKEIVTKSWPLNTVDFQVTHTVKLDLPEGAYDATGSVYKADGTVLHTGTNRIVRKKYAFEHNTIGKERVVIPPFTPITAAGTQAKVWGRRLTFGASGLPASIVVLDKEILAPGGVTVTSAQGGNTVTLKPATAFTIATKDGYDAEGTSAGTLGGLHYRLQGRLEYDGSYFVKLELSSGKTPVTVEHVTLTLPVWKGADTFSFQKNDRDIRQPGGLSRFGGIPENKAGVIFDARDLPSMTAYNSESENSFVPAIYVGSGARGLWYYADSDWEWYLNPSNEHATLERVNGGTRLRVLFVNDRLTWTGTRTFEFVLMPQPVKPMPSGWRKTAWAYPTPQYLHDTSGWRYWGDGVNAFSLPSDAHFVTLGNVLAGEEKSLPNVYGNPGAFMHKRDDPRPLVLYGSSLLAGTGPGEGEWDTYAAEWAGNGFMRQLQQPLSPKEDVPDRYRTKSSYGKFDWSNDISLRVFAPKWNDAWLDFFLYYHQKLAKHARVNGTWFDNQSGFFIDDYDENGVNRHLQPNPKRFQIDGKPWNGSDNPAPTNYGRRSHILQFRTLTKRLATMDHALGVQPFWMPNQHPTWSFCQIAWHIEADYYCWGEERDLVDHAGLDGFRALVRSQGGLIPVLQSSIDKPTQPPVEGRPDSYVIANVNALLIPDVERTHIGLCLLHDIGIVGGWPGYPYRDAMLKKLDTRFGFFDDEVTYLPYGDQQLVSTDSPRVFTSLFPHGKTHKVLAVVFNEKKGAKGITVKCTIAPSHADLPGVTIAKATDLESGEPIVDLDPKQPGIQTYLYVGPRDFRLLILE